MCLLKNNFRQLYSRIGISARVKLTWFFLSHVYLVHSRYFALIYRLFDCLLRLSSYVSVLMVVHKQRAKKSQRSAYWLFYFIFFNVCFRSCITQKTARTKQKSLKSIIVTRFSRRLYWKILSVWSKVFISSFGDFFKPLINRYYCM